MKLLEEGIRESFRTRSWQSIFLSHVTPTVQATKAKIDNLFIFWREKLPHPQQLTPILQIGVNILKQGLSK